jgi:hypothetical protein
MDIHIYPQLLRIYNHIFNISQINILFHRSSMMNQVSDIIYIFKS